MAGWYRTGTVTLTNGSATVTGAGNTLWASALRPGMVFTTDFHTLYEVKSVDGDARVTLDRPWAGASAANVAYAVIFGGAAISNAEIVAELMTMVAKWQTREDQYDDWVAGEPDGGPNGDGKYPLTDSKGVTRLVTSPGRLLMLIDNGLMDNVQQVVDMIEDDVARAQQAADKADSATVTLQAYVASADQDRQAAEAARAAAALSEGNAKTSETNSKASETASAGSAATATGAAVTATKARDDAQTAQKASEQARDTTLAARDVTTAARDVTIAARDVTTQARDQATAAQTASAASQARAQDAMSTAVNAAADSVDAKIHAVNAQTVAEQRRDEAAGHAATAQAWASNPIGQPVTSGGFSAYHWAAQAQTYAQQAQVIAGGYMFGVVGDGNAGRINAMTAADTLHLVQGSGITITFDQATRKVTFSSQARAVATEDPAVTVRLDNVAGLAYLGLNRSKIDHATLANVGKYGHATIDTHIDNGSIHVPAPSSGDVDKLLKATGPGTFAWVKGAGSGIDADKLDGRSWENGDETGYNGGSPEWLKLGRWNCQGSNGRRLLITCAGCDDYSTGSTTAAGLTFINATSANNSDTAKGNVVATFANLGQNQLLNAVKFVQVGSDRFTYDVYVQRRGYSPFNFTVQCGGTWDTALAQSQADPGTDSATVRAALNLGRLLTTADLATGGTASTVAQRGSDGSLTASYFLASASIAQYCFYEVDAGADLKRWSVYADAGKLNFGASNDAWTATTNWLEVSRSGATPTQASFKVPVKTSLAGLAQAAGSEVLHAELFSSVGNNDYLRAKLLRTTTGTDWQGAVWRIQRTVDVTPQGYIDIGNAITLGVGATARLSVPGAGADVTIDSNKIWHAGNFDPATKAGTAVATVGANGLMSAADKTLLNNATAAATANALVLRAADGSAAFTGVTVGGNGVWHAGNLTGAWLGQDVRTSASPSFTGVTVTGSVTAKTDVIVRPPSGTAASCIRLVSDTTSDYAYIQVGDSTDDNGKLRIAKWGTTQGALDQFELYAGAIGLNGTVFAGYLNVNAQDSGNEGGELRLKGAGTNQDVVVDNNSGNYRIFAGSGGYGLTYMPATGALQIGGLTVMDAANVQDLRKTATATFGGLTLRGPQQFDITNGEKALQWTMTGYSVGLYANSASMGLYDWTNGRNPWGYSPATNQFSVNTPLSITAGVNVTGATVVGKGMSAQYPTQLFVAESTHATSRRAALQVGDWAFNSDAAGNGVRDFNMWHMSGAAPVFSVGTDRVFNFAKPPTVLGKALNNWEVISDTTISSSVSGVFITLPNKMSAAGYKRYKLLITGLNPTTKSTLWMNTSYDGGANWTPQGDQANSLLSIYPAANWTTPYQEYRNGTYGSMQLSWESEPNIGFTGELELAQYSGVATSCVAKSDIVGHNFSYGAQRMFSTAVIARDLNMLQIYASNGATVNLTLGRVTLLGMK